MKQKPEDGEDVLITGFGKFCVKDKAERKLKNPVTGKDKMISTMRVVRFRCSEKLRERING